MGFLFSVAVLPNSYVLYPRAKNGRLIGAVPLNVTELLTFVACNSVF